VEYVGDGPALFTQQAQEMEYAAEPVAATATTLLAQMKSRIERLDAELAHLEEVKAERSVLLAMIKAAEGQT